MAGVPWNWNWPGDNPLDIAVPVQFFGSDPSDQSILRPIWTVDLLKPQGRAGDFQIAAFER